MAVTGLDEELGDINRIAYISSFRLLIFVFENISQSPHPANDCWGLLLQAQRGSEA